MARKKAIKIDMNPKRCPQPCSQSKVQISKWPEIFILEYILAQFVPSSETGIRMDSDSTRYLTVLNGLVQQKNNTEFEKACNNLIGG